MNPRAIKSSKNGNGPSSPENSTVARVTFWGTLMFLAVATVGLALIGYLRSSDAEQTIEVTIDSTILENSLSVSSEAALQAVTTDIDSKLAEIYGSVRSAVPEVVDFHYSVIGEYTELLAWVAQGRLGNALHERIFDGFEPKINGLLASLDDQFDEAYMSTLAEEIQSAVAAENPLASLDEATQFALNDAVARAQIAYPIAGAVVIFGTGGLKALTAGMVAKLAAKITAKTALKGGGVLAGAGGGAALCAWGGPLAAVCGAVGGFGAWILADAAI